MKPRKCQQKNKTGRERKVKKAESVFCFLQKNFAFRIHPNIECSVYGLTSETTETKTSVVLDL